MTTKVYDKNTGEKFMNNSIEIYPSLVKLVFISLGALVFVVLGVFFAITKEYFNLNLFVIIIVSYIGVPFFGLCFAYGVFRIIKKKPSLLINKDGIFDNSSVISIGLIKWNEIKDIFIYYYMGQKFLGIVPKDYQKILMNINPIKKKLMQINYAIAEAPINIVQTTVNIPLEKIIEYAKDYTKANMEDNEN